MAQDFADFAADDDEFGSIPDPEVARIVLELNRTIMRNRRAATLRHNVHGNPVPLPVKPSRVELLVLTALVQIYGPLLFGNDFGPVLEEIAEGGAVVLLQQVVFADPEVTGVGESKDGCIAARLQDARPMLEALSRKFPGAFLADARALLKRFTRPRAAPDAGPGG